MLDTETAIKLLDGGGLQEDENKRLLGIIEDLKQQLADEKEKKLTRPQKIVSIDEYVIKNVKQFFLNKENKELLTNPEILNYEDGDSAFEKNITKYYDYQKNFIENWSISTQQLAFLYYGVGTGKSLIAVSCAQQYMNLNPEGFVYFLLPASLVLDMIKKMFMAGINATQKNSKGQYIYNFISYQQLLRSEFDFNKNALLIIDEVHNLRNFTSKSIYEKKSARTFLESSEFSLVGTKLGIKLLEAPTVFIRSIFMSGTLFVNSINDIEPIISIAYKRAPLTDQFLDKYSLITHDESQTKMYFDGLISYYQKPSDAKNFPSVKYIATPIYAKLDPSTKDRNYLQKLAGKDNPFKFHTRNEYDIAKGEWIYNFIKKNPKRRIVIYGQFINLALMPLVNILDKNNVKYVLITGALNVSGKMENVAKYNTGEVNVLLFSLAIKEGISFKQTDDFIMMQPYWNYAIMEQLMARAVRSDSHKDGNRSIVNFYLLLGCNEKADEEYKDTVNEFVIKLDTIFNKNVKNYNDDTQKKVETIKDVKQANGTTKQKVSYSWNFGALDKYVQKLGNGSEDIFLYCAMLNKQTYINAFEKILLYKVNRFEQSSLNVNNEFLRHYNAKILEIEQERQISLSVAEKNQLKIGMYAIYMADTIKNIKFIRLDNDKNFKLNRNPNTTEIASDKKYDNKTDEIRTKLNNGASLNEILQSFNISKTEITTFQANFTPESEVDILINLSGIKDDKRDSISILEPTAGIGNVINGLIHLPNIKNMLIDCVEIHSIFYQIGAVRFEKLSNIKYINIDFLAYENRDGYDYILGNPPFNIKTVLKTWNADTRKIDNVDKNLFDVDFVALAYNKLNENGKLTMIISNRFLRDTVKKSFSAFRNYVEVFKKYNAFTMTEIKNFKESTGVTKEMATNFGMVCITLIKFNKTIIMNLEDNRIINQLKEIINVIPSDDNPILDEEVKPRKKTTKKDLKIVVEKVIEKPKLIKKKINITKK